MVSPTGVEGRRAHAATPNDHLIAGPDRRVFASGNRRMEPAGGDPTVGARIVFPAGVRSSSIISTPNNHFFVGPDCRVTGSGSWCVGSTGGCPCIRAGIVSPAGVEKVVVVFATPDDDERTIWIADAHRGDGKRYVVRADDKLIAFLELERAIRVFGELI